MYVDVCNNIYIHIYTQDYWRRQGPRGHGPGHGHEEEEEEEEEGLLTNNE
jgi:hypothetical protein